MADYDVHMHIEGAHFSLPLSKTTHFPRGREAMPAIHLQEVPNQLG